MAGSRIFSREARAIEAMKVVIRMRVHRALRAGASRRLLRSKSFVIGLLGATGGCYYIASHDIFSGPSASQNAAVYLQRGIAHQSLGEIEAALADFDEAVDVNPNWAEAYSARGEIYRDKGDLKRAVQEFTNSIQHKPTLHAYLSRGQVYEALGQHRKAIEDYDKATELSDSPYIYVVRALAKRNLGDIAGSDADRAKARSVARRHQVAEPQAKSEER
jgi:tetratricopeptide (TPR) repeat protein